MKWLLVVFSVNFVQPSFAISLIYSTATCISYLQNLILGLQFGFKDENNIKQFVGLLIYEGPGQLPDCPSLNLDMIAISLQI